MHKDNTVRSPIIIPIHNGLHTSRNLREIAYPFPTAADTYDSPFASGSTPAVMTTVIPEHVYISSQAAPRGLFIPFCSISPSLD
jgi:hypothetical protein